VSFWKKYIQFILLLLIIFALSACKSPSVKEQIYEHLEQAVRLEADFEEQQERILALERREQEIYHEITNLSMDEFDQIEKLADEAIEVIQERMDNIHIEKESIHSSREEFEKIKPLIEQLKEEQEIDKAEEMYKVMIERYKSYDLLHESYVQSLKEEEKLYQLLKDGDISEEEIKEQIDQINQTYEKVIEGNEQFNKSTIAYNELKKEFYKIAEINVTFEEAS